jgi:hypothetical protein
MNTKPDEETLALWLDDELVGENLAAVEAWAQTQPDQITTRAEIRQWRKTMTSTIPASQEPPYPDFFNTKILQAIRADLPKSPTAQKPAFSWKSLFLPLSACAGMALAFLAGTHNQVKHEPEYAIIPRAIPVAEPVLYTPETGVNAEWFASKEASASVIVLNGVTAIPDATDFTKTAATSMDGYSDSTVFSETQPVEEFHQ